MPTSWSSRSGPPPKRRASAGVSLLSDEQLALAADVRRDRAWPELGLTVGLAVVLILTVLL